MRQSRRHKWTTLTTATAGAFSAAAVGIAGAGIATAAPETEIAPLGTPQELVDGMTVSAYTVDGLQPSDDVLNVPVTGELWEATTSVDAVQGTVTPTIPFFNARTDAGENYRVLFQAASPEGLSGAVLPQGADTVGKIYFDVTGAEPTSIVYNDAVSDRLVWDADALAESTLPGTEAPEGLLTPGEGATEGVIPGSETTGGASSEVTTPGAAEVVPEETVAGATGG